MMAPALPKNALDQSHQARSRFQGVYLRSFCGHEHSIGIPVIPACGEGKAGLDETFDKIGNGGTLQGQIGGDFGKNIHYAPDHGHHAKIAQQQGQGPSHGQDRTRTDEQAGADAATLVSLTQGRGTVKREDLRATQRQELDMSTFEATLELVLCGDQILCAICERNLADAELLILRPRPLFRRFCAILLHIGDTRGRNCDGRGEH